MVEEIKKIKGICPKPPSTGEGRIYGVSVLSDHRVQALLLSVIVVSLSFIVVLSIPPFIPQETKRLTILTRNDISVQSAFETAFLVSDFAVENEIDDIVWVTSPVETWKNQVSTGAADIVWDSIDIVEDTGINEYFEPLNSPNITLVLDGLNSTIGGVPMIGYNSQDEPVWVATSISVESYDVLVNMTYLDQYNLTIPKAWSDLMTSYPEEQVKYLAMVDPKDSIDYAQIINFMMQSLGWDDAWINLVSMAGNSVFYSSEADVISGLSNGTSGIGLSIEYGPSSFSDVPAGIQKVHLSNQTTITPEIIGIVLGTDRENIAEGFIEFVLSAEGQALWLNPDIGRVPVNMHAFDVMPEEYETRYFLIQTMNDASIEFNQTLSTLIDYPLINYFDAVVVSPHSELARFWSLLSVLYSNGSIDSVQLESYRNRLGKPISIMDPVSHTEKVFDITYAIEMKHDLLENQTYNTEVWELWNTAAFERYLNLYTELVTLVSQ